MRVLKLLLLLFFCSCADSKRVPAQYLQPQQMQKVLMDLLIADAVNSLQITTDTGFKLQEQNKAAAEQVFKSHKISKDRFEKSYAFYLSRPDLLQPIADSMVAVANRRSTEATVAPTTSPSSMVPDSIKLRFLKTKNGHYSKDTAGQVRDR
jgi:hypothetical protein